jgi:hypothetical protein
MRMSTSTANQVANQIKIGTYLRMSTTRKSLVWLYVVGGCLTLIFQIWWRAGYCGDACALSYGKAVVWSLIWPISWLVFLRGFL